MTEDESTSQPPRADNERNPVELLAEEFAQRLRDGEHPSVQEYVDKYPDLAGALRALLPSVAMMERADDQATTAADEPVPLTDGFQLNRDQVGDFQIIRVVYEAHQKSLNRPVALKILGASVSRSPRQLERFRREAEAAARLHHTNIVPVFGMGQDSGLYFYAMQLIDGVSFGEILDVLRGSTGTEHSPESTGFSVSEAAAAMLRRKSDWRNRTRPESSDSTSDTLTPEAGGESPGQESGRHVLAHRPEYWRRVAKIGVSVASALGYSHGQGILHRDIKPSNVLLDGKGIVWVADFGLAKHEDHEGVTSVGDVVGTIRYMAPEQFNGQTDARSEIHSLGLMLYELLTLRPAYEEPLHGLLIRQKMSAPPPKPREIVPDVPRDLETIVMKACAIDPSHRYPRAEALEGDLKRYLEGRPIHARRVSPGERLWRWTRRNPVTAALSSTVAILLVAAVVVFAVGKARTDAEKQRAVEALGSLKIEKARVETERSKALTAVARATQEHARAEKNLQTAMTAFEEIVGNIAARGFPRSLASDEDAKPTAVTPADVQLLEKLLKFFNEFASQNTADFRTETATAHRRLGDIRKQLGRFAQAETSYYKSIEIYKALAARNAKAEPTGPKRPDPNDAFVIEQAQILNEIADSESRRGEVPKARRTHRQALGLLENRQGRPTPATRFELAKTLLLNLSMDIRAGLELATEKTRPGRPGRSPRRNGGKPRRPGPHSRGGGLFGFRRLSGRTSQQIEACDRAIKLLGDLVSEYPDNSDYRLELARAHHTQTRYAFGEKGADAESQSLQSAIKHLEHLTKAFPDAHVFKYELANVLSTPLSNSKGQNERIARAVALARGLLAASPDIPEYQSLAGDCFRQLAESQAKSDDLDAAAASYKQAIAYQKPLADRFADTPLAQQSYARSLSGLADVHIRLRQWTSARTVLDEAIRRIESVKSHGKRRFLLERFITDLKSRRGKLTDR